MLKKKVNSVTKCVTVKRKTRVKPKFRRIRKSIRLPTWIWISIESYANKHELNRSQSIERACMFFLSNDKNEVTLDLETARMEVAILEQKFKNIKERKKNEN